MGRVPFSPFGPLGNKIQRPCPPGGLWSAVGGQHCFGNFYLFYVSCLHGGMLLEGTGVIPSGVLSLDLSPQSEAPPGNSECVARW